MVFSVKKCQTTLKNFLLKIILPKIQKEKNKYSKRKVFKFAFINIRYCENRKQKDIKVTCHTEKR